MLTAREIHIEIGQSTQEIASNIYDKFLVEEIDWIYNKVRDRFIESCVRPRKDSSGAFELNQTSADDIRDIIIRDFESPTLRDKAGKAYINLPSDYLFLLNDRSGVISDCSNDFTLVTSNSIEYRGTLEFDDSQADTNFYSEVIITINGEIVFDIQDYDISEGLNSVNEKFVIINLILETLNRAGYNVYWERYSTIYSRDTFIFVGDSTFTGTILVDGISTSLVPSSVTNQIFTDEEPEFEVPNRLTNSGALYDILKNNTFHKTIPKSPITNLASNQLYVFYDEERFIVNRLFIDYIMIPPKMSLPLNQSCVLSSSAQRKVCDLVAEYIKNIIASPEYETKLKDNIIRME